LFGAAVVQILDELEGRREAIGFHTEEKGALGNRGP